MIDRNPQVEAWQRDCLAKAIRQAREDGEFNGARSLAAWADVGGERVIVWETGESVRVQNPSEPYDERESNP